MYNQMQSKSFIARRWRREAAGWVKGGAAAGQRISYCPSWGVKMSMALEAARVASLGQSVEAVRRVGGRYVIEKPVVGVDRDTKMAGKGLMRAVQEEKKDFAS